MTFERFESENRKWVYNLCLQFGLNRDDALDLTQLVFIRAFKAFGAYRWEQSPKNWLATIAKNLNKDRLRNAKRRFKTISLDQPCETLNEFEFIDPSISAETIVCGEAGARAIIEQLSDVHQIQTKLMLQGLDPIDIARVLDLPVGTVRSQRFRMRAKLRSVLV